MRHVNGFRAVRLPLLAALTLVFLLVLAQAAPPLLLGQTLEEFAARREMLRRAAGDAVVLIVSSYETSDRVRFRADNNVVYLTGLEYPGTAVVLVPDGDPLGVRCAAFVRTGGRMSEAVADDIKARTGIAAVYDQRDMWETLKQSLARAATVYVSGPTGRRERSGPSGSVAEQVRSINPGIAVRSAASLLGQVRLRKSAGEIGNLRSAIAATIEGFRRAASAIQPGVTELAIEGEVLAGIRRAGAARDGFPAVIGGGPNSIILHNEPTTRAVQKGETVVVDIGAEVNYYTADLTRTFPAGGRFTPRARELYDLVLAVQTACRDHIQPGKTTWQELNSFAREQLRKSPLRAADSSGQTQTMDRFLTHGIGHWLGMDVHDAGPMSSPLVVGSVITIEPGVYIDSEQIGIRIEDDYLITENGAECLSAALPRDAASIERMMRRR